MKPSLQFSIPCLRVSSDGTGPQSFESIFYELPVPTVPFQCKEFFIANGWCSGKGRYSSVLKIYKPDGSTLVNTGEQLVELESATKPYMIVNCLRDIGFDALGNYKVQITLDGELVLEYTITVRKAG